MTTKAQEQIGQGRRNRSRGIAPSHMYYRQPNGWITMGAATMIEKAKFVMRGWQPLDQYGRFDMAHAWAADNPLVTLFQFGGAKELSVEQIIECGYHLNPPVVPVCGAALTERHNHDGGCYEGALPVAFPQLEGVAIPGPFQCRFCERSPFPTEQGRNQHEKVMHKEEKGDIRTGEVLAQSLLKGLGRKLVDDDPEEPQVSPGIAEDALLVLSGVGLTRKQLEALRQAGIAIPEADDGKDQD